MRVCLFVCSYLRLLVLLFRVSLCLMILFWFSLLYLSHIFRYVLDLTLTQVITRLLRSASVFLSLFFMINSLIRCNRIKFCNPYLVWIMCFKFMALIWFPVCKFLPTLITNMFFLKIILRFLFLIDLRLLHDTFLGLVIA